MIRLLEAIARHKRLAAECAMRADHRGTALHDSVAQDILQTMQVLEQTQ